MRVDDSNRYGGIFAGFTVQNADSGISFKMYIALNAKVAFKKIKRLPIFKPLNEMV